MKIDGKWYNTDITWDMNSIGYHKLVENGVISRYPEYIDDLTYCLKSDKDFVNHEAVSKNNVKCEDSIDSKTLKSVFGYKEIENSKENELNSKKELIPYKRSLWDNIKSKFKKYYNYFVYSEKIGENKIESASKNVDNVIENKEELKPWDLRNWSDEEISKSKNDIKQNINLKDKTKDEEER